MARTVRDAALLLAAMAGADPRDAATEKGAGKLPADLVANLDTDALKGARIGILRGRFTGYSPKSDAVLDAAVAKLKLLGAEVVDPVELPHAGKYDAEELEVLEYEFKADLDAYLAGRPGLPVKTLADLIAFNDKNADAEMPYFGQELFLDCEKKGPLTEPRYEEARAKARKLSREGIDRALTSSHLDALLALSGGPAWTIDLVNGDHYLGSSTTPAAVAGYPSITVPAGSVAGLPIGVSFIGTAWSEPRLVKLAYAFEQATKARKAPVLKP
jgi:amidase